MNDKIKDLLSKLTLEEKAGLCSGKDFWRTKPVERLGIPSVMVSDGPSGLRTQVENGVNENDSRASVSFPSGCATSVNSFIILEKFLVKKQMIIMFLQCLALQSISSVRLCVDETSNILVKTPMLPENLVQPISMVFSLRTLELL